MNDRLTNEEIEKYIREFVDEGLVHELDLREADLRSVNLQDAHLRSVNLQGANLRYANLYSADLEGANLRDTDVRDADIKGAYLRGANLDSVTHTQPLGMSLRNNDVAIRVAGDDITLIAGLWHGGVDAFVIHINANKTGARRMQYLSRAASLVAHYNVDEARKLLQEALR